MNFQRQLSLVYVLVCASTGGIFASVAHAEFEVSKWEAGTCKVASCTDAGSPEAFYTQAAGHPEFGITDFEFAHTGSGGVLSPEIPGGHVKDVRVDLPPGLAVNPEATTAQCTDAQLQTDEEKCPPESKVGEDQATGTAELTLGIKTTVTESFPVYNMVRKSGEPARFGVEVNSSTLALAEGSTGHKLRGVIYLEGGISWHRETETSENSGIATGDYHEFFEIKNIAQQPEIIESKLLFWGVPQTHTLLGKPTAFLTLPSTCTSKPVTYLHVDSYEDPGHFLPYHNETPITATGCGSLAFSPSLSLTPQTTQSDSPDGLGVDLHIPQATHEPAKPNSPDVRSVEVTLPEGLTLDPSAANGLQACTDQQIGIGSDNEVTCPKASEIGEATVNAPGIPDGSLKGAIYLASQESQEPESGKQFRIFLAAQATEYGVGLRLEGQVKANSQTGRLTATFSEDPEVPFEDFILKFNQNATTPLANPLQCGVFSPVALLAPYTGVAPALAQSSTLSVDFDGKGGPCPNPLTFSLSQSVPAPSPTQAGAHSSFTLNISRADGQQYLSQVSTTLPPGLLGAIPSVTLCGEAQANAGTCTSASEIGTVTASAGAGSEPFVLHGQVYITGPYSGAPYGLSIEVPAIAGPFNLGTVVVRAQINVDQNTARLTVSTPPAGAPGSLPAVVGGVPVRLKSLSVTINRPNFLFNPTSCGALSTDTSLTSTMGATDSLSSPFAVSGCSSLAFKPIFAVSTNAKTSKATGAELTVKVSQAAGQANIHEVHVELPKNLVPRNATLQKACPDNVFNAGPAGCPVGSKVGQATVSTPVLPDKLTGPAYLVSHGGAAFPDLELILSGDGVSVILDGKTNINGAITSNTFSAIPDVPINSFELSLPAGSNSVLSAEGNLCSKPLLMGTTIVAQSGAKITQNTTIAVSGCAASKKTARVKIVSRRVKGHILILKVRTPAAGRVSASGQDLKRLTKRVSKATTTTLKVPLSKKGLAVLKRRGKLQIRVRVGFLPKSKQPTSKAFAAVKFKR